MMIEALNLLLRESGGCL